MDSIHHPKQRRPYFEWVLIVFLVLFTVQTGQAAPQRPAVSGTPSMVSYQGQVSVSGQPYTGIGFFKFAVVDGAGTATYWSNDGKSTGAGEPLAGVPLDVQKGLFSVLLGDTSLAGMTQPLSADVFSSGERYLRVWFSATLNNYTQLSPDQRIASVPYALGRPGSCPGGQLRPAGRAARL